MCLQPIRGVEGSDYINASFIDGYRSENTDVNSDFLCSRFLVDIKFKAYLTELLSVDSNVLAENANLFEVVLII